MQYGISVESEIIPYIFHTLKLVPRSSSSSGKN